MTWRTAAMRKMMTVVADFNILFAILNLSHLLFCINAANSDDHTNDEGCPSNHFPCYFDCCKKGEWYCHEGDQRCNHCATREHLCGNELLPRDCLLHCYKLLHPPNVGCESDENSFCIPWFIFIAAILAVAAVFLAILIAVVTTCVCMRRTPLHKWPACLRASSDDQNGKDSTMAEEERLIADNTTKDIHSGKTNSSSPPSPFHSATSLSNKSNNSIELERLNLTGRNDGNNDGEQTYAHRRLDDGPSQQTRAAVGNRGPPTPAQTTGSSQGRSRPHQGHDPGRDAGTGYRSSGSSEQPSSIQTADGSSKNMTPPHQAHHSDISSGVRQRSDEGNTVPPTPQMATAGSSDGRPPLPQDLNSGRNTGAGRTSDGSNGAHLPPPMAAVSPSAGIIPPHQDPDHGRDIEVRAQRSPDSRALTCDHGVHDDPAQHAAGHLPPPPQQSRQSDPPRGADCAMKEMCSQPDFRRMNPTPDDKGQQCHVIVTSTTNPADNYRNCAVPDQPHPPN